MQMGVYPALILFPAEMKKPLLYEGDMAVIDVMKFLAEHGSNFHHLVKEKGKIGCDILLLLFVWIIKKHMNQISSVSNLDHTVSYGHCHVLVSYSFLFLVSTCISRLFYS